MAKDDKKDQLGLNNPNILRPENIDPIKQIVGNVDDIRQPFFHQPPADNPEESEDEDNNTANVDEGNETYNTSSRSVTKAKNKYGKALSKSEKADKKVQKMESKDDLNDKQRKKLEAARKKQEKLKKQKENAKANLDKKNVFAWKMKKIKLIIKLVCIGLCVIFGAILILFVVLRGGGGVSTSISYNDYMAYKVGLKEGTDEEYEYFWSEYNENASEENDYSKSLLKAQERFIKRFNSVYDQYENRIKHPDLEITELRASQMHVLSTILLDYTPEAFAEDISESSIHDCSGADCEDDIYGEINSYNVCDDEGELSLGCLQHRVTNEEYSKSKILELLLNLLGIGIEKYEKEKDSLRLLARNTIVYKGQCYMEKIERQPYTAPDGTTKYHDVVVETNTKLYDPVGLNDILKYVLGIGEDSRWKDKKDCDQYEKPSGEWDRTKYSIIEDIDLCYYYDQLLETDYFEKHMHFKHLFEDIREKYPENYDEKAMTLKQTLVDQIIYITYLTMFSESSLTGPTNGGSGLGYNDYTLSDSIYITVLPNESKEYNGGSYPLDEYVAGVLGAEVGVFYSKTSAGWATKENVLETWKAMAVAIRSYTLARTAGGERPIPNSSAAQNFNWGVASDTSERANMMRTATSQTAGQVLMMNNRFFSSEYDSFYTKEAGGGDSVGGFHCDETYCYVTYSKKGSSPAEYHEVKVPASWRRSLAGGHGRGISQWGSLYLSTQGYNYSSILGYFYGNQVTISGFDYGSGETPTSSPTETVDTTSQDDLADGYTLGEDPGYYAGKPVLVCPVYKYEIPVSTIKMLNLNGYYDESGQFQDDSGDPMDVPIEIPDPNATQTELGQKIVDMAMKLYQNYNNKFCYVNPNGTNNEKRIAGYNDELYDGFINTDCNAFVAYVVHHAINAGPSRATDISHVKFGGHVNSDNSWSVGGSYSNKFSVIAKGLTLEQALAKAVPGDILGSGPGWHVQVYVGNGQVVDNANSNQSGCGNDLAIRSLTGAGTNGKRIRHQESNNKWTIIRVKG